MNVVAEHRVPTGCILPPADGGASPAVRQNAGGWRCERGACRDSRDQDPAAGPVRGAPGPEEIPLRAFGGRRAQQLLRLLALRRGALVPKDIIAEALWPVRRPGDAGGNIEVLVSRIRRALGDRTLVRTGSGGYALTGDGRCWVDAEAFVAAVEGGRTRLADSP